MAGTIMASTMTAVSTITAEDEKTPLGITAIELEDDSSDTMSDEISPTTTATTTTSDAQDPVRLISLDEYKSAASTLVDAFADDHVAWYFLDTPDREHWTYEQKWDLHEKTLQYITYAHCLKGLVVTAGPDNDCVALWMPPGENMDDLLTIVRSGMWRLNYQLSSEGRKRFFHEFLPLLNDTKAQVLGPRDDQSWYLVYIGTKPASRGKGYARKVIDFVTKRADAEGRACYLESSNLVNRIIYGKLGFETKKMVCLRRAEENIDMDIMVREPRRVTASEH